MQHARKHAEMDDPWMSLPQAAAELGLSKYLVLKAIARGDLDPGIAAGREVVSRVSVAKLKESKKSR